MRYLNHLTVFLIALTSCSDQPAVVAQPENSDDGIITKIEEILGRKGTPSEAFIVLKNDEVRYMADMEIIFFDKSVKDAFEKLRQERSEAKSKMSIEAINNNPEMAKAMQELNASRIAIAEKERSIDGKVEEMRLNLIANLKDSFKDLSQQLESGGKVLEEFKEIITPYDTEIQETRRRLVELKEDETVQKLEQKAFEMVNDYIIKNNLKVPKLSNPSRALDTKYVEIGVPDEANGLIIEKRKSKRFAGGTYYKFTYFTTIPAECHIIEPKVVALLEQKESVESQASYLRSEISSLISQRSESLIPWENRHNADQDQFEEQYGRITREHENTKQRLDALQNEGPERERILQEIISQINKEIAEQLEQLDEA